MLRAVTQCLIALVSAGVASASLAQEPAAAPPSVNCDADTRFDFSTVPPALRPLPRFGLFPMPPSGPGYYSFVEWLTGQYREAPPKYPYTFTALSPLPAFEADWRFVDDPSYDPDFLERLKRIHVGDNWLFSTGGQMWFRYQNEFNARLGETDNNPTLLRLRPYLDVWYQDRFRFFIEGIFAESVGEDIPPLPSDVNRADFQNLFVDAKLATIADKGVYARVGRQEVQLGSQRLIGTPDWANIRRTWNGARLFRVGDNWNFDLFWLQPLNLNPTRLDSGDANQNFAGAFATYKPKKGAFIDAYYMMLDNTNTIVQTGIVRAPFTLHTIGGRYAGDIDDRWLWDTEAAIQIGQRGQADLIAGMYAGCLGYHWMNLPWNPTFWAAYSYESGDNSPNSGTFTTFNQLFPFIQWYQGWVDAVGRQNDHDLNLRLYLYPDNWITVWLQYHHFWLAEPRDALYGILGNAIRRDPTGQSGTDVGQKIEVSVNFHTTKRIDVFLGYTYFWGGEFLRNTAGPDAAVNGSVFWFCSSLRW